MEVDPSVDTVPLSSVVCAGVSASAVASSAGVVSAVVSVVASAVVSVAVSVAVVVLDPHPARSTAPARAITNTLNFFLIINLLSVHLLFLIPVMFCLF